MQNMLCVVDMQYPFVQAGDEIYVAEVLQLVRQARQRQEFICLLEDQSGSATVEVLAQELRTYKQLARARKCQWDGSLQVAIELGGFPVLPAKITACGAFAEQCVAATLVGLRCRFPLMELELKRRACVPAPVRNFSASEWECFAQQNRITLS